MTFSFALLKDRNCIITCYADLFMEGNMKHKTIVFYILWITIVILISGCSAHNPFIITNTSQTIPVSDAKYPPHSEKVYISSESISAGNYDVIGFIEVGKIWYGSSSNILLSMAERARELGADAVIEVKTWHQPSGFSWAAPHGSGRAIKFKNKAVIDFSKIKGEWL